MKVLTAEQMREVDRLTIERGIPGIVLMENAAHRVVEFLERRFAPLANHRIAVLCGKGNNGGDGLAIARLLFIRFRPRSLHVVITASPEEYRGDAAANLRMLAACGCTFERQIGVEMQRATLVIDAILGTGLRGPAAGPALSFIEAINSGFPDAKVVAVDLPSGMNSDEAETKGVIARADASVTFTAPKICHALAPNSDRVGELLIGAIGTPPALYEDDPSIWLSLVQPRCLAHLFQPRPRASNKGDFGHALLVGGSVGKTGSIAMSGMAALRAGAGLVTIATPAAALAAVAAYCPELMTGALPETDRYAAIETLSSRKTLLAIGPGMGVSDETVELVRSIYGRSPLPVILDADAINCLPHSGMQTSSPSSSPSIQPSVQSATQPYAELTGQSSGRPAVQPSGESSIQPSAELSGQSSGQPSIQLTAEAGGQPPSSTYDHADCGAANPGCSRLSAGSPSPANAPAAPRIFTPHPGEMARLAGTTISAVQADRLTCARTEAKLRNATIVLKGQRTLIAFPDGRVWINPTGTPAMATAGTGDILTGLMAGLAAQFPGDLDLAVAASVWLHGRAGELAAAAVGEKSVIATDLLRFIPEAIRELEHLAR